MSFYKECFSTSLNVAYYCVSPKIRLTMKIRPSMNFHDDCNIRPTHKISQLIMENYDVIKTLKKW